MRIGGLLLLFILVFGGSMMFKVDKHGYVEIKAWGMCKKGSEKMYAIVPIMSSWKYNNLLYVTARRVAKSMRDLSHNLLRVDIGRMTLNKCEYIQIKHLMEQWNIDIAELCRYSLMSVVNAHTDLVKARVE